MDFPPSEILIGGKRLVRRGLAKLASPTASTAAKALVAPPDPEKNAKIDQLPLEELADKVRLVTLLNGYEYIEAEPDIDRAAKMRADKGHPVEAISPPGAPHVAPPTPGKEGLSTPDNVITPDKVIGTDNRVIAWDNTTVPYNSYLAVNSLSWIGSAVTIGRHTAITAGHMLFDNGGWINFDPANPTDPSYLAPGANIGQSPPNDFPWGKFTCFTPWVYNAWISDTGDPFWDMGVMDFSGCPDSNNPGWVAGYNGSWANMNLYGGSIVTVFGYPGDCPAPFIGFPQVCGMGGPAYLVPSYPSPESQAYYVVSAEIDTSGGTSGASWTWKNPSNNWYYTIGTHKGYYDDWIDGTTNYARRLANEYWSLVQQVSVDF